MVARGCFKENWQLDLAVTAVAYIDGDPRKGASVTVETHDRLVAPSSVEIRYDDGATRRLPLPAVDPDRPRAAGVRAPTERRRR